MSVLLLPPVVLEVQPVINTNLSNQW